MGEKSIDYVFVELRIRIRCVVGCIICLWEYYFNVNVYVIF